MKLKRQFMTLMVLTLFILVGAYQFALDYSRYGLQYEETIIINNVSTVKTVYTVVNAVGVFFLAWIFGIAWENYVYAEKQLEKLEEEDTVNLFMI